MILESSGHNRMVWIFNDYCLVAWISYRSIACNRKGFRILKVISTNYNDFHW